MRICPRLVVVLSDVAANYRKPWIIAACILASLSVGISEPALAQAQPQHGSPQAPRTLTPTPTGRRQPCRPERRFSARQARHHLRSLRLPRSAPCNSTPTRRPIRSHRQPTFSLRLRSTGQASRSSPAPMRRRSMLTVRLLEFRNSSTAGPATLNAFNTGPIAFLDTSNAGTATITAGLAGSNAATIPMASRAVSYSSGATARLPMRRSQVFGLRTSNFTIRATQVMRQSPPP